MFVMCYKKCRFVQPTDKTYKGKQIQQVWEMNPGFIGDVPEWVTKDWYFQKMLEANDIVAPKSKNDKDVQAAAEPVTAPLDAPSAPTAADTSDGDNAPVTGADASVADAPAAPTTTTKRGKKAAQ